MTKKFPGLKDKRGPSQNIRILLLKTAIGPLSSGIDAFRSSTLFLTVGQYYVSLRRNRFCPLSLRDLRTTGPISTKRKHHLTRRSMNFLNLSRKIDFFDLIFFKCIVHCKALARAQCTSLPYFTWRQVGIVKMYPCTEFDVPSQSFLKPEDPTSKSFPPLARADCTPGRRHQVKVWRI